MWINNTEISGDEHGAVSALTKKLKLKFNFLKEEWWVIHSRIDIFSRDEICYSADVFLTNVFRKMQDYDEQSVLTKFKYLISSNWQFTYLFIPNKTYFDFSKIESVTDFSLDVFEDVSLFNLSNFQSWGNQKPLDTLKWKIKIMKDKTDVSILFSDEQWIYYTALNKKFTEVVFWKVLNSNIGLFAFSNKDIETKKDDSVVFLKNIRDLGKLNEQIIYYDKEKGIARNWYSLFLPISIFKDIFSFFSNKLEEKNIKNYEIILRNSDENPENVKNSMRDHEMFFLFYVQIFVNWKLEQELSDTLTKEFIKKNNSLPELLLEWWKRIAVLFFPKLWLYSFCNKYITFFKEKNLEYQYLWGNYFRNWHTIMKLHKDNFEVIDEIKCSMYNFLVANIYKDSTLKTRNFLYVDKEDNVKIFNENYSDEIVLVHEKVNLYQLKKYSSDDVIKVKENDFYIREQDQTIIIQFINWKIKKYFIRNCSRDWMPFLEVIEQNKDVVYNTQKYKFATNNINPKNNTISFKLWWSIEINNQKTYDKWKNFYLDNIFLIKDSSERIDNKNFRFKRWISWINYILIIKFDFNEKIFKKFSVNKEFTDNLYSYEVNEEFYSWFYNNKASYTQTTCANRFVVPLKSHYVSILSNNKIWSYRKKSKQE